MQQPVDHLEHGPPERATAGVRLPPRAGAALVVAGAIVVLLVSPPLWSSGRPEHRPSPAPASSAARRPTGTAGDVQAMADRGRAVQSRFAMIRAVPPAYRRAAERASGLSRGRTPPEFFLALAFNRTLYGALLEGATGRPFAHRGPLQWQLAEFRRLAGPGHDDPAVPLDAFLAVDAALDEAGLAAFNDAFTAAIALGAMPDHARADDETFAVLSSSRGQVGWKRVRDRVLAHSSSTRRLVAVE